VRFATNITSSVVASYDTNTSELFYTDTVTVSTLTSRDAILIDGSFVGSDSNIKQNISYADLSICYSNVKNLPLRYFGYIPSYETSKLDKNQLGFIAQEVYTIFPKSIFSTFNRVITSNIFSTFNEDLSSNIISTFNEDLTLNIFSTFNEDLSSNIISTFNEDLSSNIISTFNEDLSSNIISTFNEDLTLNIFSTFNEDLSSVVLNLNFDQIFLSHYGTTQLLLSSIESYESSINILRTVKLQQQSTLQGQQLELLSLENSYETLISKVSSFVGLRSIQNS